LVERADMAFADDRILPGGRQTGGLARLAEQRVQPRDILLAHHRRGEPGVAQPRRPLHRDLDVARHPDRRSALLLRLEAGRHAAHRMEAAAMLDLLVAPQLADQLDALDEARHALLERHADRIELLLAIAETETDD